MFIIASKCFPYCIYDLMVYSPLLLVVTPLLTLILHQAIVTHTIKANRLLDMDTWTILHSSKESRNWPISWRLSRNMCIDSCRIMFSYFYKIFIIHITLIIENMHKWIKFIFFQEHSSKLFRKKPVISQQLYIFMWDIADTSC